MLKPEDLAALVSDETGLAFTATAGKDAEGQRWILLAPSGVDNQHGFGIRISIGWRRVEISFEPGAFAAPLLGEMGSADIEGRNVFSAMLESCRNAGAEITLRVNGNEISFGNPALWADTWTRFDLRLRKGNLELGDLDAAPEIEILREWALRFAAAIIGILPLDGGNDIPPADNQQGFPEGAVTTLTVNKYERDRRNRAAAIAIHGISCMGCGMSFSERYGEIALGFIEVHHIVPVSKMSPGYIVDPARDLVPLCSNCHSVVHRVDPPLSIETLRSIVRR